MLDPGQSTFAADPPPGLEPVYDDGELVGYARAEEGITYYYDTDGNLVYRQIHEALEATDDLLWFIPGGGGIAKGGKGLLKRLFGRGVSKTATVLGARAPMHVLRLLRKQATTKADRLAANRLIGLKREAQVLAKLRKEGYEHLGSQVAVKTKLSLRHIDHLVRDPKTGEILAIEVKSGGAVRSAKQLAKDTEMERKGAEIVGKNAHGDLKGQTLRIKTEVRN